MAKFRVTGIKTGDCPAHQEQRYIVEAQIVGSDGPRAVGVSVLRLMLSSGDDLYTQSPTTDATADVTKGKCECGFKTVRSVRSDVTDNDLVDVPAYH